MSCLRLWIPSFALLLLTCSLSGCFFTCEMDGEIYQAGESFPCSDGCNTCSCEFGGGISSTLMACMNGCMDENGLWHNLGESWPATDGCNTCECAEEGGMFCTEMACIDPDTGLDTL